jgi:hypothetical protein
MYVRFVNVKNEVIFESPIKDEVGYGLAVGDCVVLEVLGGTCQIMLKTFDFSNGGWSMSPTLILKVLV